MWRWTGIDIWPGFLSKRLLVNKRLLLTMGHWSPLLRSWHGMGFKVFKFKSIITFTLSVTENSMPSVYCCFQYRYSHGSVTSYWADGTGRGVRMVWPFNGHYKYNAHAWPRVSLLNMRLIGISGHVKYNIETFPSTGCVETVDFFYEIQFYKLFQSVVPFQMFGPVFHPPIKLCWQYMDY